MTPISNEFEGMEPEHDLPEEILMRVLEKLPAKSLLRFRSVSKSWRSVIQDPYFTQKILKTVNKDDSPMIFLRSRFNRGPDDYGKERLFANKSLKIDQIRSVTTSYHHEDSAWEVIGSSCNGILCLAHWRCGQEPCQVSRVSLYNPITRQEFALPPSLFDDEDFATQNIGFGFGIFSNDYKVIRIRTTVEQRRDSRFYNEDDDPDDPEENFIEIYRSSTDSWSKLNLVLENQHRVWTQGTLFFNGLFHWFHGVKKNWVEILTFDFHAETFDKIELGQEMNLLLHNRRWPLQDRQKKCRVQDCSMAELDGSLAIFMVDKKAGKGLSVDIWVMEGYEHEKSWAKKFSVESCIRELTSCYRVKSFGIDSKSLVLLCKCSAGVDRLVTFAPEDDGEGEGEGEGEGCKKFKIRTLFKPDKEHDFNGVSFTPTLISFPRIQADQ